MQIGELPKLPKLLSGDKFAEDDPLRIRDAPPAASPVVRSDAMWLAEHWGQVEAHFKPGLNWDHHPVHIRTACRKAGYEWALVEAWFRRASKPDLHHPHHIRNACRKAGCGWRRTLKAF